MAAYFTDDRGQNFTKHVGSLFNIVSACIKSVQLDGDELEFVRNEFSGIRMCKGRMVTLFEDDARFVAHHWR